MSAEVAPLHTTASHNSRCCHSCSCSSCCCGCCKAATTLAAAATIDDDRDNDNDQVETTTITPAMQKNSQTQNEGGKHRTESSASNRHEHACCRHSCHCHPPQTRPTLQATAVKTQPPPTAPANDKRARKPCRTHSTDTCCQTTNDAKKHE